MLATRDGSLIYKLEERGVRHRAGDRRGAHVTGATSLAKDIGP